MIAPNISLDSKTILVTGAAGFIGANLVTELVKKVAKVHIIGIDNMNDYYDVSIKKYRLGEIEKLVQNTPNVKWDFIEGNIADRALIDDVFANNKPIAIRTIPPINAKAVEVFIASFVFCRSFSPICLATITFAPTVQPVRRQVHRVIRLPQAPTAPTAVSLADLLSIVMSSTLKSV